MATGFEITKIYQHRILGLCFEVRDPNPDFRAQDPGFPVSGPGIELDILQGRRGLDTRKSIS